MAIVWGILVFWLVIIIFSIHNKEENKLSSTNMNYAKMTKQELITLIENKDKKIKELENKATNNSRTKKETSSTSPISFEIINFYANKDRIELLWTNASSRSIHFIKGTLKFYDKNNKLLGVESKHICSDLNAHSKKAEVLQYLNIPYETNSVRILVSNIYYY